ncbi:MAG: DNA polymerase III subunit beta [Chlamydiales bacterium]
MKFVIATQELNELINKIQNVVSLKPPLPILSNFLLEAYNDELVLTATDMTVGIRCFAEAQILEEGATTLPVKTFAGLIRELSAPTVQISTNSNHITTLVSGTSRFKINGMSKDDYPALPDLENAFSFTIKQDLLKDLLYRTSFALSKDDNRYALTGALMDIANATVTFVGTNGKKLARAFAPLEIDPAIHSRSIIPAKAVDEFIKNLTEVSDVKLFIMNDKIALEANKTLILSLLLTGEYPDISRLIPEKTETILNLHREELVTMLRQISLFRPDSNHSVRFVFQNGELQISANTSDIGEGQVAMPVNFQGDKLEVAFNPGYFLDILRHCKGETVSLGIIDSYNPGIIVDSEQLDRTADASPLFLIMPMRLSED